MANSLNQSLLPTYLPRPVPAGVVVRGGDNDGGRVVAAMAVVAPAAPMARGRAMQGRPPAAPGLAVRPLVPARHRRGAL